jgi:membrane-associated protease RseP (regulator of RpoE activity)
LGIQKIGGKWRVVIGHRNPHPGPLPGGEGANNDETIYSINAIPLGGFVKIWGENNEHESDPRSFINKPFGKRFATLVAGVVMNVVLAWVLLSAGFMVGMPTAVESMENLPKGATLLNPHVGVLEVLEKSAAKSLLERAEKGVDTVIGEGGIKVSGGEKQRISIARALLRKPSIIVFDEATSALDSITEQEITKTIRELGENSKHMTILIAHRLSTIMHADRIYVLEKGKVVETGTHAELLDLKGLYSAMWREQIGER